jgi:hypothetical protein
MIVRSKFYYFTLHEILSPDLALAIVEEVAEKERKKRRIDSEQNAVAQFEAEIANTGSASSESLEYLSNKQLQCLCGKRGIAYKSRDNKTKLLAALGYESETAQPADKVDVRD